MGDEKESGLEAGVLSKQEVFEKDKKLDMQCYVCGLGNVQEIKHEEFRYMCDSCGSLYT